VTTGPFKDTRWLLWLAAGSVVACVVSLVAIDHPLAAWVRQHDTHPSSWNFALAFFEYATGIEPWRWTGTIVLAIGALVTWYTPRWHRFAKTWLFVALSHFISVNLMMWCKHFTGRLRPHEWHYGAVWRQHGGSFPSGHVVLIGSLIIPLAIVYPRARTPVLIFLAFVCCARIAVSAHWASDVFGGIALVTIVTWVCAALVHPLRWPDRYDQTSES
jgi:membrane-associated phospholipid phosphatase